MAISMSWGDFNEIPNGTEIKNHHYSQCVAVANLYSEAVLGNDFVQVNSAYEWWTLRYVNSILLNQFYPQGSPTVGSIFVSLGGIYDPVHGHIGVVTAVHGDGTFDTMEQNTGPWYPQRYLYRYRRSMTNILGFLNPVNNPAQQGDEDLTPQESQMLSAIWQGMFGPANAGGKTMTWQSVDGPRTGQYGVLDIDTYTQQLVSQLIGQIAALTVVVQQLPGGGDIDMDRIVDAAEKGAKEALGNLTLKAEVK